MKGSVQGNENSQENVSTARALAAPLGHWGLAGHHLRGGGVGYQGVSVVHFNNI